MTALGVLLLLVASILVALGGGYAYGAEKDALPWRFTYALGIMAFCLVLAWKDGLYSLISGGVS